LADNTTIDNQSGESKYAIDAAVKTLQVLFSFRHVPHSFSIAEVERRVGFSKNQVFRCLKSLEEFGVVRVDTAGKYRLTPLIRQIAYVGEQDAPLEEVAAPIMERLQQITGETVNLCSLVDEQTVIIARRHSNHGVRLTVQLGQRSTLHAGANPKAILAFLPMETQEKVISMLPMLRKYTDRTASDPDAFRRELAEIRMRGFSISDEDFELGARGVGAPIFGEDGRVIGGISAGGPTSRVGPDQLMGYGSLTVASARRISRLLGSIED